MPAISVSAFAKQMGVTPYAVRKAMRDKRISHRKDANGNVVIDAIKAAEEWARNTDPVAAKKAGKVWPLPSAPRESQAEKPAARALPSQAAGDEATPEFMESRASREWADAQIAHLKLRALEGTLVSREVVEKAAFDSGRIIHDELMNMADRMSPWLASETDHFLIATKQKEEYRRMLKDLADKLPAALAQVVD